MSQTLSQVLALVKETVEPEVPDLFEKTNPLYKRIKAKGKMAKVGARDHRMAKKVKPGGQFRYVSLDGGDLGRGNAAVFDKATLTPVEIVEAVETNKSVEVYTGSDEIAIESAFKDNLADAMEEMSINLDKSLNASATGVLETTVSGTGGTTWTVTNRGRGLRVNSRVTVYDNALAGPRTGGTPFPTITAINPEANTIVVDGAPSGITDGDVLLPDGLSGATPTVLFNLKYHHNNSTSATWMNLSRTTYQNLRTPTVSASSGALTLGMLRLLQNKIEIARGSDVFDTGSWEWYGHQAQRHSYEELGFNMLEYDKAGGGDSFDGLFDPKKLRIQGRPLLASQNADPTRLDLCDWKNWGRAETVPVSLYDVDEMTQFQIYGTSGGVAAASIFYLLNVTQFYVMDPQRGGYISSLAKPSSDY